MSDNEEVLELRPNTPSHEQRLSDSAKSMVGGCMDLISMALQASVQRIDGGDPLSAERYVHLAEKLSLISDRLYTLGEAARIRTLECWEDLRDEATRDHNRD